MHILRIVFSLSFRLDGGVYCKSYDEELSNRAVYVCAILLFQKYYCYLVILNTFKICYSCWKYFTDSQWSISSKNSKF